jgi:hypothetical protein
MSGEAYLSSTPTEPAHIIMTATPITIPIMHTDGQVIKYQIPGTRALAEEFNCITMKYKSYCVSIMFTFSSVTGKLLVDL